MKSDDRFLILLVTVPADDTGEKISRQLVEHRLAACVNRIPSVRSVYRWRGRVESDNEELLIVKTGRKQIEEIERTIRGMHPYDLPEMLIVPVEGGSEPYLDWLARSLRDSSE